MSITIPSTTRLDRFGGRRLTPRSTLVSSSCCAGRATSAKHIHRSPATRANDRARKHQRSAIFVPSHCTRPQFPSSVADHGQSIVYLISMFVFEQAVASSWQTALLSAVSGICIPQSLCAIVCTGARHHRVKPNRGSRPDAPPSSAAIGARTGAELTDADAGSAFPRQLGEGAH
jgi:hypothetical protein